MNKKETGIRGEAKGMPLTIKGRRVSKDYLIEHGIIKDYFTPSKKEKSENCIYIDTIYRQDAIEAICKACSMEEDYHKCDGYPETSTWCDELVALRELPPAQPEKRTEERAETHACDCISRQAAIDSFRYDDDGTTWNMDDIVYRLEQLPSAQPEIIHCRDCRWRKDQSGSTEWLPCRAIVTPSDFYCGRAERRTDE